MVQHVRVRRLLSVLVFAAALLGTAAPADAAAGDELRLEFDSGETLASGTRVTDTSGRGHHGTVRTASGGTLSPVTGWKDTTSARYPAPCSASTCPKAVIEVPDAPGLDPYNAAFEWGARVLLNPDSTSPGENLLQKGLFSSTAAQWKLQVDGLAGTPSCLVSGYRADGGFERVLVETTRSIADGSWHSVVCRRTTTEVVLLIDGTARGRSAMTVVKLASSAPVTVGAKSVDGQNNDQFFGTLDEVFVRRL